MALIPYTVAQTDDRTYLVTTIGGVEYYISREPDGRWSVATRRKCLGRWNIGGFRTFNSLAEMAQAGKRYMTLAAMTAEMHADLAIARAQEAA